MKEPNEAAVRELVEKVAQRLCDFYTDSKGWEKEDWTDFPDEIKDKYRKQACQLLLHPDLAPATNTGQPDEMLAELSSLPDDVVTAVEEEEINDEHDVDSTQEMLEALNKEVSKKSA